MANVKELEARVRELEVLLGAHRGTDGGAAGDGPRPDFIEFGSPRHAALLGLVKVDETEDTTHLFTYTSPHSGVTYRLADEYEPVRLFPAMDPEKAAWVILRQKVGELEGGPPPVPEGAPEMWRPRDAPQ